MDITKGNSKEVIMKTDQLQLRYVNFNQGSYIVFEGIHKADRFFIINQGKVKITKEAQVEGEKDEILGPGDFFGVVSTMSFQNHIETALALTDVVVITVYQNQYEQLIQKNPQVAKKIMMQFSKKLRHLNLLLAKLTLNNTADDGPAHLYNVAEYFSRNKMHRQAFYTYTQYLKHCPGGEHATNAKRRLANMDNLAGSIKTQFNPNELNRKYSKDTMIFAEGEPGNEFFIIQDGSVKISKIVDQNEVLLAVIRAGDIFGEMALLEGKPRNASAMAFEDCEVMVINKHNFELMIINQPQLMVKVTALLAERIWFIYKQLANTLISNPIGRIYDALLIQLEKNRIPLDSEKSYHFNFGWPELVNMIGLAKNQSNALLTEMVKNKRLRIMQDKIFTHSIQEIVRRTEYYRKAEKFGKLNRKVK